MQYPASPPSSIPARTPGPSPSKRTALPPATPEYLRDPFDITRGSLAHDAKTGHEEQIRARALQVRHSVSRGQLGVLPTRRGLSVTQSEPTLSFASKGPSRGSIFQTSNETLESVFSSGGSRRGNELRPMWDTVDSTQDLHGSFTSTGSVIGKDGFRIKTGTTLNFGGDGEGGDDAGGDGFDMDEVFGESASGFGLPSSFARGPLSFGEEAFDSQGSTETVTARLKRAFEEEETGKGEGEDEEMEMTEDEDDVGELPPPGRNIVARRGLSKTQSLPANVFSQAMF